MDNISTLEQARQHWQSMTETLLCIVPARTRGRHLAELCDKSGTALPLAEQAVGVMMYSLQKQTSQEVSGRWLLCKAEAEVWRQRAIQVWQYVPPNVARAHPNPFEAATDSTPAQAVVEWDAEALQDTEEMHFAPFAKLEAYIRQCSDESACAPALPSRFDKAAANQNGFYICLPPSTNKWKIRIKQTGGRDFHYNTSMEFWQAVLQAARAFYGERGQMPHVPLPRRVCFLPAI